MEKTDLKKESPAEQKASPATVSAPAPEKKEKPKLQAPKKKSKWPKRIITIVVIVAVIALVLTKCMGSGGANVASGSYLPATAVMQEMTVSVTGTATIEPIDSYKVTTLVRGEILEAPFEVGDTIQKGALLFRIDSTDLENTIQQAQLSLESAQLSYNKLLKDQSNLRKDSTVRATETGVITKLHVDEGDNVAAGAVIADILDRDHMKLEVPFHSAEAANFYEGQSASVTVDGTLESIPGTIDTIAATDAVGPGGTLVRNVTILVNNPGALSDTSSGTAAVGSVTCASSAVFTYASSKQVVAKASGELKTLSIREGDRVSKDQVIGAFDETDMQTSIDNARIQIENAQLTLTNAQEKLKDYSITSTITGTVIEKKLDVGDNIDGTTTASASAVTYPAIIYDLSALTFDIKIDELDINKIKVGQTVEITADALDGKSFTGHVDKININGTTQNGVTTYPVTVLVDSPDELLPGMNISATIIVENIGTVLSIPVDFVSRGNTVLVAGPGCMDEAGNVVNSAAIETRPVTLGRNDQQNIEILEGLQEGDVVLKDNKASSAFGM